MNILFGKIRFLSLFVKNTEEVIDKPRQILLWLRVIHDKHSDKFDEVSGDI